MRPTDSQPAPQHPHVGSDVYNWSRFGRHRLRVPAGVLIDSPLPGGPGAWLGTIWPDADAPGGWARMLWQPDPLGRGWIVPARLAGGDVLEFGRVSPEGQDDRWFGILDSYDAVEWLTIQGPYREPAAANDAADRALAVVRYERVRRPAGPIRCGRAVRRSHP